MESNKRTLEVVDLEEKEVDWLTPQKKDEKLLPLDFTEYIKKFEEHSKFSDRILRIAQTDFYLMYIRNEIFVLNSSNMDIITHKIPVEHVEHKILDIKMFGVLQCEKEILKITIDPIKAEYISVLLQDLIIVYKTEKILKLDFTPLFHYKLKSNSEEISDVLTFSHDKGDKCLLVILNKTKSQLIFYSNTSTSIVYEHKENVEKIHFLNQNYLCLANTNEFQIFKMNYPALTKGKKDVLKFIEKYNLNQILEDEENDYKINYITSFANQFICLGAFQKEKSETWSNIEEIKQHFYFIKFVLKDDLLKIQKFLKSEYIFFYNDEYNFKTLPEFSSIYYKQYDLFILHSNQQHTVEFYYLEADFESEDPDDLSIMKAGIESDRTIFLSRNNDKDRMFLFSGAALVDFKHKFYHEEKTFTDAGEVFAPPLFLALDNSGKLNIYSLFNTRDSKCVLVDENKTAVELKGKFLRLELPKYEEKINYMDSLNKLLKDKEDKKEEKRIGDLKNDLKPNEKDLQIQAQNLKNEQISLEKNSIHLKIDKESSDEKSIAEIVKIEDKPKELNSIESNKLVKAQVIIQQEPKQIPVKDQPQQNQPAKIEPNSEKPKISQISEGNVFSKVAPESQFPLEVKESEELKKLLEEEKALEKKILEKKEHIRKLQEENLKKKREEERQIELEKLRLQKEEEDRAKRMKELEEREKIKKIEMERDKLRFEEEEKQRLQKEKEERIKNAFERLLENLNKQLKCYSEIFKNYTDNSEEKVSILEKNINSEVFDPYYKYFDQFTALGKKIIDENNSASNAPSKSDFDQINEKVLDLLEKKSLIDKLVSNAEKNYTDEEIESLLLAYNTNTVNKGKNLLDIKKNIQSSLPRLKKQLDLFGKFLTEMKDFQNEFTDRTSLNQKLKYYKKYAGVLNKFKQEKVTTINQDLNQSHFESVNQSSIYECIMKKYEKIFIDLDIKYHKVIQGKMKTLEYDIKLYTKHPQAGFSIFENEISDEFAKVKSDINYLGHNPKDNVTLYKQLNEKLLNIFKSHTPKINYVDDRPNSGKEITVEEFFMKKNEVKKRVTQAEEKNSVNLHSQEYLVTLFEKVQKKKEEMNKEFQKIKLEMAKNQQLAGGATTNSSIQNESSKISTPTPNISSMKFTDKPEKEQNKEDSIFANKSASSFNVIPQGNLFGDQKLGDKFKQEKKDESSKNLINPGLPKKEEKKDPSKVIPEKNLFSETDINKKNQLSNNIFSKEIKNDVQTKPAQTIGPFSQKSKDEEAQKEKSIGNIGMGKQMFKESGKNIPADFQSDKAGEKKTTTNPKEENSPFTLLNQSDSQSKEDKKPSQESTVSFFSFKGKNSNPLNSQLTDKSDTQTKTNPLFVNQEKSKNESQAPKEQPKSDANQNVNIKPQNSGIETPKKKDVLPQQSQQNTTFNMGGNLTSAIVETNTQKKPEEKKPEQIISPVKKSLDQIPQNDASILGNISSLNINANKENVTKEPVPSNLSKGVSGLQPQNPLNNNVQSNKNTNNINSSNQTAFSNLNTNQSNFFNNPTNQQGTIISPQSQNMQPQGLNNSSANVAPIQPKFLQLNNLDTNQNGQMLNLQGISLPANNASNMNGGAGFGAKASLGVSNPLQGGFKPTSSNIAMPPTVFGQGSSVSTNQSGFSTMSNQGSGNSGFMNVISNQNQGGFFNNNSIQQNNNMNNPGQPTLPSGLGMMGINTNQQQGLGMLNMNNQQQPQQGLGMFNLNTNNQQVPQQHGSGFMNTNNQQMPQFNGYGQNQNFGQGGFQNMNQQNPNVPNMQGGNKKMGDNYDYF